MAVVIIHAPILNRALRPETDFWSFYKWDVGLTLGHTSFLTLIYDYGDISSNDNIWGGKVESQQISVVWAFIATWLNYYYELVLEDRPKDTASPINNLVQNG